MAHIIRRIAVLLGVVALGALAFRLIRRAIAGPARDHDNGPTTPGATATPDPGAPAPPSAEAGPTATPDPGAPVPGHLAADAPPHQARDTGPSSPDRTDAPAPDAAPAFMEPEDGACPSTHPVKAKEASGIFHVPGGLSYERTAADRCYASPEQAEADGYRAAKR